MTLWIVATAFAAAKMFESEIKSALWTLRRPRTDP
jgi:hypothetical protein